MIAADTSALFALYANEPEAPAIREALEATERALIAAPTAFEYRLVVYRRHGAEGLAEADPVLALPPFEIMPWNSDLIDLALQAFRRFGGRPANLNYGDCMSYALAKSLDVPLLYKGNDFAATDIRSALG